MLRDGVGCMTLWKLHRDGFKEMDERIVATENGRRKTYPVPAYSLELRSISLHPGCMVHTLQAPAVYTMKAPGPLGIPAG